LIFFRTRILVRILISETREVYGLHSDPYTFLVWHFFHFSNYETRNGSVRKRSRDSLRRITWHHVTWIEVIMIGDIEPGNQYTMVSVLIPTLRKISRIFMVSVHHYPIWYYRKGQKLIKIGSNTNLKWLKSGKMWQKRGKNWWKSGKIDESGSNSGKTYG